MKTSTTPEGAGRRAAPPNSLPPPLARCEETISAAVREAKTYIRREPTEAVLWALAAGYVLRMLPLGAILNLLVRTLLISLKPAIILFGATKIWDVVQESSLLDNRRR